MPGRHNASSIEGGIFAEPVIKANAAMPSNPNAPSQVGGIFGAQAAPAPVQRTNVTKSSVDGGIFGSAPAQQVVPTNRVSNSSIEGGIFGGYNHVEAPVSHMPVPKVPVEALGVAGSAVTRQAPVSLGWEDNAPLAPLPSARSNPNAPSQAGGIFGSGPPPQKQAIARHNPNQSSIQGGIFG